MRDKYPSRQLNAKQLRSPPRRSAHIFLAADGCDDEHISRLVVAAPWAADRTASRRERLFAEVIHKLEDLRAGKVGRFRLRATPLESGDPLIGPAKTWFGVTPYLATRNLKKRDEPRSVVKEDVIAECHRRGLPAPTRIEVVDVLSGLRGVDRLRRLRFTSRRRHEDRLCWDASHFGGGLFRSVLSHT